MSEHLLIGLASIAVLGVGAQWLAWVLRVPSILILLLFGFAAGPVGGFLDPDRLLGDLLFPVVSLSVAVILFEGGLSLKIAELRKVGTVVWNLVTVGAAVTWAASAGAAYWLLGLDLNLSVLFGAISVVTGPTVIMPLLRYLRPGGAVGPVLKWEAIVIDPIGAVLAVLVFEAMLAGGFEDIGVLVLKGFLRPALVGGAIGAAGAGLIFLLLRRYWVPDFLQNPVSLMAVVSIFTLSNFFQEESGLVAVTVMGVILANQKTVAVRHILEFKENLRVLLISTLFILLAARLKPADLMFFTQPEALALLAVLLFLARPLAVGLSTLGSSLNWRERAFLSWLAPRGIVAASVSSLFALRLTEAGYPEGEWLVSLTFLVIVGTVVIYGLTAAPAARWLGVASPNPQGALILGAHTWAREIGKALKAEGYPVVLVDDNYVNASAARMTGLPTFYANILSEYISREIDLGGVGRLLALTPNNEINTLASLHYAHLFGRSEVYQLPFQAEKEGLRETVSPDLHGRLLFGQGMTYARLTERFLGGATLKKTPLKKEFDYEAFQALYGGTAIPLFRIDPDGDLSVFTLDKPPAPKPGQVLISIVDPQEEEREKEAAEEAAKKAAKKAEDLKPRTDDPSPA